MMNIEPGFGTKMIPSQSMPTGDETRRSRLMAFARRRPGLLVAAGAIALVVLLVLLMLDGAGPPAAGPEPAPRVTVMVPGRLPVDDVISATGTIAARREMPVGVAGEGGMIDRVLVDAGDWVRDGQVLATIDAAVQREQARQLQAQIAAAQADVALAEQELNRSLALVGRGFVSKADVDRKQATRDATRARVRIAEAQLAEIQARLGRLSIRAPGAGLVLARNVEPGQVVGPGDGALFRLASKGEMELRANMVQNDLARLSVGAEAEVTPAGSPTSLTGRVWQVSPVVDPRTRQGEARVLLGYDKSLRPGGFANVTVRSGTMTAALLPESAVLSDERGNYVFISGPDNRVVRRDVKVGPVTDTGLPIIEGLAGNEKVVVSAGAFLHPGDPIKPVLKKPAP